MSADSTRISSRRSFFCTLLILLVCFAGLATRSSAQTAHLQYAKTEISYSNPNLWDVAVDSSGNVFVTNYSGSVTKATWSGGVYTVSTIATGLNSPYGIAVDSSDNLYIAESQTNHILKMERNAVANSYGAPTALPFTGLNSPWGIAVDGSGRLYIADTYNNRVLREAYSGSAWVQTVVVDTGLKEPQAIDVDASGDNVYIADTGNLRVLSATWNGSSYSTPTVIASGLNAGGPAAVAVDSGGTVYVTDMVSNNARLLKLVPSGNAYTQQVVIDTNKGLSFTNGLAVDSTGNLYIANAGTSRVIKLAFSALNYGEVPVGSSGTPVQLFFQFDAAASIAPAAVLTMGAANQDFTASSGTCWTGSGTYAANGTCDLTVTFSPKQAGARNGAAVLRDKTTGAPLATVYIYGTGVGPQIGFAPPKQSNVNTTLQQPVAVAVDGSGNVYIATKLSLSYLYKAAPAGSAYSQSPIFFPGMSDPSGIAVDGAGNLYVSDGSGKRVIKGTLSGSTYTVSTIADATTNGLGLTNGVAVDGSGNVYIADTGNNRVLKQTLSGGSYTQSVVDSVSSPLGVAVDGTGNVYITTYTSGTGQVVKETLSGQSYARSEIASGFSIPIGIAVDGSGNVYITDQYANIAVKETLSGGSYSQSMIANSTNGLQLPFGVAVDGAGNVYMVASGINRLTLKLDVVTPPSLSFASTAVGEKSSDSPKTVTVSNGGNAALTLPVPLTGTNPSVSGNFTWDAGSSCPQVLTSSSAASLVAGGSCTIALNFQPTTSGSLTGNVVLTDDNLNATSPYATQSISLAGTATAATKQSQTITFIFAGPVDYGTAPTLTASATSNLTVSFSSATTDVCSITSGGLLTTLKAGSCTIYADQAGDATYEAAPQVSQTFNILAVVPGAPTIGTAAAGNGQATVGFTAPVFDGGGSIASFTVTSSPDGKFATGGSPPITVTGLMNGKAYTFTVTATNSAGTGPASAASNSVIPQGPQAAGDFGSVQVGASSSTVPVTLTFASAGTVSSAAVLTMGAANLDFTDAGTGSCTISHSYAAGDACTVDVNFSPKQVGTRNGAVVLKDNSAAPIAMAYIYGTGIGPRVSFSPPTESTVTTIARVQQPYGLAVDGDGNVYLSSTGVSDHLFKETVSESGYSQSQIPLTMTAPKAIAIDGAGNLYLADGSGNQVLKATLSGGTYTSSKIGNALSIPYGVAVDGAGNVYIADTDNGRIVKETLSGTSYTQTVVADALSSPGGVAVDGSGNVYISDSGNGRILKETPSGGSYTQSVIDSGLNIPVGIAVDGTGNVYVGDVGTNRVLKETLAGGSYSRHTIADGANNNLVRAPYGIAVDGNGNVYIACNGSSYTLKEDVVAPPLLNFGSVNAGQTSSAQSVAITNNGNATLNAVDPGLVVTGSTNSSDFVQVAGSGTPADCTTTFSLAPGAACNLSLEFTPGAGASGSLTGSATLTDNNLNASPGTQTIALAGTAIAGKQSQTITFNNPGPQNYGTSPTLTASASSGLTVTFSSTSESVCTVAGTTLTTVSAGSCTINANQAGDATYDAAAQVSRTFSIVAVKPGAPTIGTATAGDKQATVSFTAPSFTGGAITGYTVTSAPGSLTGTGTTSPITVAGLTNGTAYTFTVTAGNSAGTGDPSGASNSVTPKASQTIDFVYTGPVAFGASPKLSAIASSGLTVTFSSATMSVCTITSDGVLATVSVGSCRINADQIGNSEYLAAQQVSQSFSIIAREPDSPTNVTAAAGDGQATVSFSAPSSNGGATITGYTATSSPGGFTGTGPSSPVTVTGLTNGTAYTFTVTATNSAGTSEPSAASGSVIPKKSQTITFNNPGTLSFSSTTIPLSASASSGLRITFSSETASVCAVTADGVLTTASVGTCTINADQSGNSTYLAAPRVSQTFSIVAVVPGAPTIGTATAGNAQATVTFTPPTFTGGSNITGYVAISSPGSISGSGAGSPITVTGLTNGTSYTFTVQAINSVGASVASAPSNFVTPTSGANLISIRVSPSNTTVAQGSTQQFTATGRYSNGTSSVISSGVSWSSSNTNVASIDTTSGLAMGVAPGSVTITAAVGTIRGSASLTVTPIPVSITLTPSTAQIPVGASQSFTAVEVYSDNSTHALPKSAIWTADTTVATMGKSGLFNAVGLGTTTITVKADNLTGTATLTTYMLSISPATATASMATGTAQFSAIGTFKDASTTNLTGAAVWKSSKTKVATVSSNGVMTLRSTGTTTITATVMGVTASATLTVTP